MVPWVKNSAVAPGTVDHAKEITMVEEIFSRLGEAFQEDKVERQKVYYFSVDELKRTVTLAPEGIRVEHGKTVETADCVCKTSTDFFLKVWQEGYRPGMADFLSGAIKSNDPFALQEFLAAFGKGG
jgi:putative sterol carrier protein